MSLRSERDQLESYAVSLEQEADALQHKMSAAAAVRGEEIVEDRIGREASAKLRAAPEDPASPEEEATSLATAKALFRSRAERLRELAATASVSDRNLLLAIAADYEEMARTLTERPSPNPR